MTALDKTPENKNFLSPLNFKFQIKKAPHVNFFIQQVNIPAISLPPPMANNPFVRIPYPGEHINYEPLVIDFKVDEDLQNYLEIHNWMKGLGSPSDFAGYSNLKASDQGLYSDATLVINNSRKRGNMSATFIQMFPIDISDLQFTTMDTDVNYLECSVDFRFLSYEIGVLNS